MADKDSRSYTARAAQLVAGSKKKKMVTAACYSAPDCADRGKDSERKREKEKEGKKATRPTREEFFRTAFVGD